MGVMEHVCNADGIPVGDKKPVSGCSGQLHLSRIEACRGISGTEGAAGSQKRCITERPTASLQLGELPD